MTIERARAMLFGLALGDALGYPTEFLDLPAIERKYGPRGIDRPPDPALYSDDTQMTLALAEGLLDAGAGAPLDTRMEAIGRRFKQWKDSPENNRAPGVTCLKGIARYETGMSWQESGVITSKGCGSAMRVAPIGYLYQHEPERLREIAAASSVITHRHPTALAAAIGAAYAVKLALDGVAPGQMMRQIAEFVGDEYAYELHDAFHRVGHVAALADETYALTNIGQGWTGEEALALALYCAIRSPDDYVAAVRRAANSSGDSDSVACIAGGILGARLGLDAIPADWRARCENAPYLDDLAGRLAAARS